jgi:plastocyanin
MITTNLLVTAVISSGLALSVVANATEEKETAEQTIDVKSVPAAVQKAAEAEAKGGKIVRWEKEGASYEVVIKKSGKEWGVKMDATGKVLGKHDESKEKGEKGEKY